MARPEERAYREYVSDEQRSQPRGPQRGSRVGVEEGCPARELCDESLLRDTRPVWSWKESRMRHRLAVSISPVVVLAAIFALAAESAIAQPAKAAPGARNWRPSKTPWGDPDLQGTWTSDDCIGTPLNRPANLREKRYYNEQELAQRESQPDKQQQTDLQELVGRN